MIDASDVVVTLLTGRRPDLLAATLDGLCFNAPGLLETAHVVALHNGDDGSDDATVDALELVGEHVDEWLTGRDLLPVGLATSRLAAHVPRAGRAYWLHLEDDWRATKRHPGWLDRARELLAADPRLAQVRLRLADERVLARHMVTGRQLRWIDRGDHQRAADAHWTNNPALMRAADVAIAWPADGERDAQRRWHRAGHRAVAQLVPGEFKHLGEGASLWRAIGSKP